MLMVYDVLNIKLTFSLPMVHSMQGEVGSLDLSGRTGECHEDGAVDRSEAEAMQCE